MAQRFVLAALPFLLTACGPSPQAKAPAQCVPPTVPEVRPPGEVAIPESTVTARLQVPVNAVAKALQREIPHELAAEKNRSIGAAGRATYTVRRGKVNVRANRKRIAVSVPVKADIRVCKPFGAMCVGYGQCSPSWRLTYSIDNSLGEDFSLSKPKVSVKNTERCVIAIDVTPQLDRVVKQQARRARKQMIRQMPDLAKTVKQTWSQWQEPIRLADGRCAHIVPKRIGYRPPRTHEKNLSVDVVLSGRLVPADSCERRREAPPPLTPKKLSSEDLKQFRNARVWFPEVIPWAQLEARLTENLEGPVEEAGDLLIADVRLLPARNGLMLGLTIEGPVCGTAWVQVRPTVTNDGRLQLADALWHEAGPKLSDETQAALENVLRVRGDFTPSSTGWLKAFPVSEWTSQIDAHLPQGFTTQWSQNEEKPLSETGVVLAGGRAKPGPEGLWVFVRAEGHVRASVQRN